MTTPDKSTVPSSESRDMCDFIRDLSDQYLDYLVVTPPLGEDVLRHALDCKRCATRLVMVVEATTAGGARYANK
jgi:hypothetical protein